MFRSSPAARESDAKFVKEATAAGFVNLKGQHHEAGLELPSQRYAYSRALRVVEFMKKFEAEKWLKFL